MLALTHLNGTPFWLNPELILTVETTPDTLLTLTTGDKWMIRETPEQVAQAFRQYKFEVFRQLARIPE